MFHVQPFILFQGFVSGPSDFSNRDSAHNISEVNLDLDQNDKKLGSLKGKRNLKKNSLFSAVLKMEFLGLCWCCLDMSQAVTSVMFCYVNMLR